ncbi:hypothetical protein [Sphingopyxis sp. KK2]|uniref:hypothetical protein n=1 Tax=Sphingopyxis sp. KK2 TaxID=1855727 RepID=UPI00097E6B50|nr:hypothetical protein [Sphingopyxis sp. KK2]
MSCKATLSDVFEISGRGCVVTVQTDARNCRAGDILGIGEYSWEIIGIDIPRYSPETLEQMREGWKPPIALLLKDAMKAQLSKLIGQEGQLIDGKQE